MIQGRRLRLVIEKKSLKQENIAESLGMSNNGLARWLNYGNIPHYALLAMEYKYGFSLKYIQTGKGKMFIDIYKEEKKYLMKKMMELLE